MAIDFSALVLGPTQSVFGRAVVITPTMSQPGAEAYSARGIYSNPAVEVPTEMGFATSRQPMLGIRLSDFNTAPAIGDRVTIDAVAYLVHDRQDDGQGGSDLILRRA